MQFNFCDKCGARITPDAKFCGKCGTKIKRKNFCGKCGAKLKHDAKFCGKCGAKVYNDIENPKLLTPIHSPEVNEVNQFSAQNNNPQNNLTPPQPKQLESVDKDITKTETKPTESNKSKPNEVAKPVSQQDKKLLTEKEIRSHIGAGGTFLGAIIWTVISVVGFALTAMHPGCAMIGILAAIGAIIRFCSTSKKIKQRKKYTLLKRYCTEKVTYEDSEGDKQYNLYFIAPDDGLGWLVAPVKEDEYNSTEICDYFYLAIVKCKDGTYDVAAYFKESEWRLE